ncbi:MAG: PQQ-binding-like beta-propeller repeat protein [bacterium]|nr:PQQ-binding-like beta-propeller repeat protein [bacterium]
MKRLVFILCLVTLGLASCGKKYRLSREEISSEGNWAFSRGDLSATGSVDQADFDGRLEVLWENSTAGKPIGPLALYNKTLLLPESRKRINFYDIRTGLYRGRVKTKGIAQSGAVIQDSLVFYAVGPRRNKLFGYNLLRRKTLWARPLRDAMPGPIIVDNRLLVSSGAGSLLAYSPQDGSDSWRFDAEARLTASASFADGRLFQPADRSALYALAADDGRELYRVELKGSVVSVVAIQKLVYVTDVTGHVYALEPSDGSVVWEAQLEGPVWTSPALAEGRVFVGHSGGEIVALDAADGHELWRYRTVDVVKASPVVIGRFLVVGTLRGRLLVLRTDDGSLVDEKKLEGAIEYSPVTDGKRLMVVTQAGKIVCYGENNEQPSLADQGIDSQHEP